ncbi:MAG TPA: methylated-DNA--[protein]-cysteine S-methyltransferase [Povalibacter sp.]|nr:methylated-DNA--[protein]-cysteine S-methyltransferase [Povalibacter sp.]
MITETHSASADSGEFRSAFLDLLGNPAPDAPTHDAVRLDWIETPVGPLLAGVSSEAVVLLEFSDRKILEGQLETLRRRFKAPVIPGSNRWLKALRRQLGEYFAGRRRQFELPLAYPGTQFQERVWSQLLTIPYGETWSYLEMARKLGDVKATRAVGTANGMNRIAIVIPCHRVINANGELGGYGGGLWRKRILLDLEQGQGGLF